MKKKAIAELEFRPFLQAILRDKRKDDRLVVRKGGHDAELWFETAKVSGAPDYEAHFGDGKSFLYEFQYAENTANLEFFDFKVSKVGKKKKGKREPHRDREFFYVVKSDCRYGFFTPEWIMQNGKEAAVPAWGSRVAFRVPREVFLSRTMDGGDALRQVIAQVDNKNDILLFQSGFLPREAQKLAERLERAVDEKRITEIVPDNLTGFFETCLLLDRLKRYPENIGLWLVYACSFFSTEMSPLDFGRWAFCVDFLYFIAEKLRDNEISVLVEKIRAVPVLAEELSQDDGSFTKDPAMAPFEETRAVLSAINLVEDITQHLHYRRGQSTLPPAAKIYQSVPDCARAAAYVRKS